MKTQENKSIFQKFKNLNEKLQLAIKIVGAFIFLSPLIITGIKNAVPYLQFVVKGPELVSNVQELKRGLLTVTGALADNAEFVDSILYSIEWRDHKYTGRLKRMKTGDIYVFLKDGEVGEQVFLAIYHRGTSKYHFIDFDGNYIKIDK